jgi:hypothetical protein
MILPIYRSVYLSECSRHIAFGGQLCKSQLSLITIEPEMKPAIQGARLSRAHQIPRFPSLELAFFTPRHRRSPSASSQVLPERYHDVGRYGSK